MPEIPNCSALIWSKIIVDYDLDEQEALEALRDRLHERTGSLEPDVVAIMHSNIDQEFTARFEDDSKLIVKGPEMRILAE